MMADTGIEPATSPDSGSLLPLTDLPYEGVDGFSRTSNPVLYADDFPCALEAQRRALQPLPHVRLHSCT